MPKKFYAVQIGRQTGIYTSWDDCKVQVHGYPNAVYKSFTDEQEAKAWLFGGAVAQEKNACSNKKHLLPETNEIIAYVDGSYNGSCVSYGAVIIDCNGESHYGACFDDAELSLMHNVGGEIFGALFAMKEATIRNCSRLVICYDYQGISAWALGQWQAKTPFTQYYRNQAQHYLQQMDIEFVKIKSHSGDYYNNLADRLAKEALNKAPSSIQYFK